ncbi:hypothetical protein TNCV_1321761 [Trichonephila clavipes]|nr:hypothetical protein TNCV_1321761 [Trichonephila clavipes]
MERSGCKPEVRSGDLRGSDFCAGGKVFLYLSLLAPYLSCSSSGLLGHFPGKVEDQDLACDIRMRKYQIDLV